MHSSARNTALSVCRPKLKFHKIQLFTRQCHYRNHCLPCAHAAITIILPRIQARARAAEKKGDFAAKVPKVNLKQFSICVRSFGHGVPPSSLPRHNLQIRGREILASEKDSRAQVYRAPHTGVRVRPSYNHISFHTWTKAVAHARVERERERRKTPRKRAQPSNSMRGRFGSLLSLSLPMIVLTLLSLLVSLSSSADFLPSRARFISIFISCRAALGLSSLLIYLFCLSRSLASERVWLFLALITHAASERRRRKRRRSRAPTVYTNELSVQISILTANLPANRSPTSPPMYSTAADRRGKSTRWLLL